MATRAIGGGPASRRPVLWNSIVFFDWIHLTSCRSEVCKPNPVRFWSFVQLKSYKIWVFYHFFQLLMKNMICSSLKSKSKFSYKTLANENSASFSWLGDFLGITWVSGSSGNLSIPVRLQIFKKEGFFEWNSINLDLHIKNHIKLCLNGSSCNYLQP